MKSSNEPKKKKLKDQYAIIHIDPDVHKKLKIHCVTNEVEMGRYATLVLRESLKNPDLTDLIQRKF
jgi:hypothetical protein